jgi:hydroxyacylglutathione hydrolase
MLMRMIYDDSLAQAAYLIGCQKTGEAVIFDPQRDINRYIQLAEKEGLTIVAASETHIHADFLSGVREFCEQTNAKAFLSGEGGDEWSYEWVHLNDKHGKPYNHQILKDGDEFQIGNINFRVLHTPGHTPEHICFEVSDRGGEADEPMGILTGDFIFVGDVGRPDLLETAAGVKGNMEPSAKSLGASLRKFQSQPDYLQVWPGHGSGSACGKALGAVPQSTVGYEKRFNDALKRASDEEGFVHSILSGQPEPPAYFARMKVENRSGPSVLGELPQPTRCTVEQIPENAVVIDTREWESYREGHIPGSLSVLPNKSFSVVAGAYIKPEQTIVLVTDESDLEDQIRMLIRIGLDQIAHYVDPSALAGRDDLEVTGEVSVQELNSIDDPVILDVRNASELLDGYIPGVNNVAYLQLPNRITEVPQGRPVYVSCRSGFRSARASSFLNAHGIEAVNVAGGFLAWEEAGLKVEHPSSSTD